MDTLLQDLIFALRLLWRDKGFATAVVLTLGLCIGANVTIFTVVYSKAQVQIDALNAHIHKHLMAEWARVGPEAAGQQLIDDDDLL